jgi:hypothetical protein
LSSSSPSVSGSGAGSGSGSGSGILASPPHRPHSSTKMAAAFAAMQLRDEFEHE